MQKIPWCYGLSWDPNDVELRRHSWDLRHLELRLIELNFGLQRVMRRFFGLVHLDDLAPKVINDLDKLKESYKLEINEFLGEFVEPVIQLVVLVLDFCDQFVLHGDDRVDLVEEVLG